MARFLPFDPSHDQIYEEYQVVRDSLNLPTVAFEYVLTAAGANARIIILTGDAGHGKTFLCRRIIEKFLGYSEEEAREIINRDCDGQHIIKSKDSDFPDRALRVFKDFSELSPDVAAQRIEATDTDGAVTIICANEGRLRAVFASTSAGKLCRELLGKFSASFEDGRASNDGRSHIVNLNYQSAAAGDSGSSLSDLAIRDWTSGTRWRSCTDCDSRDGCPIFRNREMLSEVVDEKAAIRKKKLTLLLATLERIGYVITIRDMLMTFAYLLTGGLKCKDVHQMNRRRPRGWQHDYAFYNLAFDPPDTLSKEQLKRLPLMQQLPRLDPGRRAARQIDERIVNEQELFVRGQLDLQFLSADTAGGGLIDAAEGIDEIIGDPRSRKQRADEAGYVTQVVRALRRRAFFDGVEIAAEDMLQLGFPHGADFLRIVNNELDVPARMLLKRRVIAGLHHIQGLQFAEQTPTLHLVDPAFGRSTSGAAILATKIQPAQVDLIRLSEKWGSPEQTPFHISKSVDWIDRHLVLRVSDQNRKAHDLMVDLMTFDCILRAAAGHVPPRFYEHDLRRVASFLGRIAQSARAHSEQIDLVRNGRSQTISIDGGTIQVSAGT